MKTFVENLVADRGLKLEARAELLAFDERIAKLSIAELNAVVKEVMQRRDSLAGPLHVLLVARREEILDQVATAAERERRAAEFSGHGTQSDLEEDYAPVPHQGIADRLERQKRSDQRNNRIAELLGELSRIADRLPISGGPTLDELTARRGTLEAELSQLKLQRDRDEAVELEAARLGRVA